MTTPVGVGPNHANRQAKKSNEYIVCKIFPMLIGCSMKGAIICFCRHLGTEIAAGASSTALDSGPTDSTAA